MELLTETIRDELLANGRRRYDDDHDPVPVVKLFCPNGAATWLLTELDANGDTLHGLCDLGFGSPELGSASLRALAASRFTIERDRWFDPKHPLSVYALAARRARRIVELGPHFAWAVAKHQEERE